MALAQVIVWDAGIVVVDIVVGDVGRDNVHPPPEVQSRRPLQRGNARIKVRFTIPVRVFEIVLKIDHENT